MATRFLRIIKGNPDTRDVSVVVVKRRYGHRKGREVSSRWVPTIICPSPSIRPSCAPGSRPSCASARCGRWKMNTSRGIEAGEEEFASTAEECSSARDRHPPLRKGETNIADHFEDATIIFADVVGFTKITARMRAFEIVACLNRLFSEFDRLADDIGGEKIKTIGDSYMAAVGLPAPRPNHARIGV